MHTAIQSANAVALVVATLIALLSLIATIDDPSVAGATACLVSAATAWWLAKRYRRPATPATQEDPGLLWYVPRTHWGLFWRMVGYGALMVALWHFFTGAMSSASATADAEGLHMRVGAVAFITLFATYIPTELTAYLVVRRWSRTPPPSVFLGWLVVSWILGVTVGVLVAQDISDSAAYVRAGLPNNLLALIPTPLMFLVLVGSWLRYIPVHRHQRALAEQQARAAQAEQGRQLAEAQLAMLQAQIEPHFLYNTLASVKYLVSRDAQVAEHLLDQLIRYLRHAMPKLRQPMSTLKQEFELADAYTQIVAMRMGGRLTVSADMQPGLEAQPFPPLVLQTLVENAIKHGLEPKVGPVHLWISASRRGDEVVLEIQDDGVGLSSGPKTAGSGAGLANIRERLAGIYGDRARLAVMEREGGGVVAIVTIALPHADAP